MHNGFNGISAKKKNRAGKGDGEEGCWFIVITVGQEGISEGEMPGEGRAGVNVRGGGVPAVSTEQGGQYGWSRVAQAEERKTKPFSEWGEKPVEGFEQRSEVIRRDFGQLLWLLCGK